MSKTLIEQREEIVKIIKTHERRLKDSQSVLKYLENQTEKDDKYIKKIKSVINYLERELDMKKIAFKLADLQTGFSDKI